MKLSKVSFVLACLSVLSGCATTGNWSTFDPQARETMVRVTDKLVAAVDVRQASSGANTVPVVGGGGAVGYILITLIGSGPKLTVYEYVVVFPDGRKLSVFSDYPHCEKGNCVKVFESEWRTYPRLTPGWGCEK